MNPMVRFIPVRTPIHGTICYIRCSSQLYDQIPDEKLKGIKVYLGSWFSGMRSTVAGRRSNWRLSGSRSLRWFVHISANQETERLAWK